MAASPVTFSVDADGVGWVVFDAPGRRANVFTTGTQVALAQAIDAAESHLISGLVVCGAKDRIFIAGADLRWLQALPDVGAAMAFSRGGQALFQRLAAQRVPVVCAIHGACAGGGLELALACDWRIASGSPSTRIGLPETGLGTIPGWGGCVRLPRLIGTERAVDHILRGQLVPAADALDLGIVDEVVPAAELRDRAKAVAQRFAHGGRPMRPTPPLTRPRFFAETRDKILARTHGHAPAQLAAIDAVAEGWNVPLSEAFAIEARHFGEVTAGPACKNLIHVFFLREAAKKRTLEGWFEPTRPTVPPAAAARTEAPPSFSPRRGGELRPIHRVGVVGAGVMGSGIAHWLATHGYDVVLRDVRRELIERAVGVIRGLFEESVRRGRTIADEAGVMAGRIRTTIEWDGFADCDLVIEAIVENVAAKQQLFGELAAIVRPDALLASNTSVLPIDDLAGRVPNPARTLGIHFFNPVSRMPLVELILGRSTSAEAAERVLGFVRSLGKSPVICRSSPGFVVTRVLFFYLNAAVRMWEAGVHTAAVDAALRGFGWPMGPLRLIDEVGIDVTAFIFGEMAHYYPERFVATTACEKLMRAGLAGRKNGSGRGFYRYGGGETPAHGASGETINDDETRPVAGATWLGSGGTDPAVIVGQLMQVMIDEARRCVTERVVLSPEDVDFALLAGAGFPAFRGGLLREAGA
jgi:3-hydroxyacyl-CoA dehydrogenase / enoyl-CoA hydratase / 3-hydroxybutyryl-CoA epimerase